MHATRRQTMPKIDGVQYPDGFKQALKDKYIAKAFLAHMKKEGTLVALKLFEVKSGFDPETYYEDFFVVGGKNYVVTAAGDPRAINAARQFAKIGEWDRGSWKKIHVEMLKGATVTLDNELTVFYKSKAFEALHAQYKKKGDPQAKKEIKGAKKDVKIPDAMLKRLGISDKKAATEIVAALRTDNVREAEKLAEKALAKEKSKEKPRTFIGKFRKMVGV
jgi:hypothetical protein